MDTPEITTARLRLRQWQDADYEPFARLNADPRVMEFFPRPLTRAESNALADRLRVRIRQTGWGLWAVEVVGSAPFIGFVGLNPVDASLPLPPGVEVAWRIAAEHWGKGFTSEAAAAALAFGFETVGLAEIVAFTSTLNHRSRKVMERIGLASAGQTFEHPNVPVGSPLREHVVYRLTREGWRGPCGAQAHN